MSRRRSAIWAALLGLAWPIVAVSTPAHAGSEPELTLVAQDAWTLQGGDFRFQTRIDGAAPGFVVAVVAHERLDDFAEFEERSTGEDLGSTRDVVRVPIEFLPADAAGNRSVTVGLEAPGSAGRDERLSARQAGVYPLEIELRDSNDETRARFVTYLVVVAPAGSSDAIGSPLGVAWIWPLVTPPTLRPDGTRDPDVMQQLRDDGRLGRQVLALAQSPDIPVTLVPGPDTVQTWGEAAEQDESVTDGAAALRTMVQTRDTVEVLPSTYVPVNLASLLAADLSAAVDTQLVAGDAALFRFFEQRPHSGTALVDPADARAVARLRIARVNRVVVDSTALVQRESDLTPARPFDLEAPAPFVEGRTVPALAAERRLADLLGGDAPAALRAQRFLAALSVIAFEDGDSARAVAVLNPRGFDVPTGVLEAALAGLRGHPWLRPMRVDDVFDTVPAESTDEGTLVRQLAPSNPPGPPVSAAEYNRAAARLSAFDSFAPGAPGSVSARRALLASVSSEWTGPTAGGGRTRLAAVDEVVRAFLAGIRVPAPSTITLTDRSGDIPLTLRNDTGQPVSVRIVLQSPKLSFPNGAEQVVQLPRRSTTIRFAVESRTSGSFPLRLIVRSVDGGLTIAEARFRVEATAVSTVGLVLIVSAVVFLALWWAVHIRRERHRKRRPQPVPVT